MKSLTLKIIGIKFNNNATILGRFFNIEEDDTAGLLGDDVERSSNRHRPWMLRIQNGKIHNVRAFACSDIEMI